MRILTLNCGSSSLKYAVFETQGAGDERPLLRGSVERIGEAVADHTAAVQVVFEALARAGVGVPEGVGHRVVHGGAELSAPARVDGALLDALDRLVPFAPLHMPSEIRAIRAAAGRWPGCPQVACFDTAFHRSLPEVAWRYPFAASLAEGGVRRYGFHGLSYEYVVASVGAGELGRAVLAHLGSGASLVAVRDGRPVDTTMGFTPTGGLVMGTRPGDLDPGLVVYLLRQGYDAGSLERLFNHQSGLLALSGSTADVKELLSRRDHDERAALALDAFAFSARKWIGAMAATVGGLDTLVFTGGIGEHAPLVRRSIVQGLEHLGVHLDDERNTRNADVVSVEGAPCRVRVVQTDEERMVARHTRRLLG